MKRAYNRKSTANRISTTNADDLIFIFRGEVLRFTDWNQALVYGAQFASTTGRVNAANRNNVVDMTVLPLVGAETPRRRLGRPPGSPNKKKNALNGTTTAQA